MAGRTAVSAKRDAYGQEILNCHKGVSTYEIVEREDGLIDIGSALPYFQEFENWPLAAIRAHRLENGVNAIGLTFATNKHERRFEITGVNSIQLERDAAGFPTVTEFVTERERIVLRFTERPRGTPIYTGNSWGE